MRRQIWRNKYALIVPEERLAFTPIYRNCDAECATFYVCDFRRKLFRSLVIWPNQAPEFMIAFGIDEY